MVEIPRKPFENTQANYFGRRQEELNHFNQTLYDFINFSRFTKLNTYL
jgi:hypothetical protein